MKTSTRTWVIAGCLLILLGFQAALSMRQKSVTVDELMYITAGYHHLKTGDFYYNATNPPLMKLVPAAALLALDPVLPPVSTPMRDWSLTEQWSYARAFLFENRADAGQLLLAARFPVLLLSMVLGLLVFSWSRKLYGDAAGLLSLLLFCFSPNVLAHARLATQDLGLATVMFGFTYAFWRYFRRPSAGRLLGCGVLFGLALLTKTAGWFLLPIAGLYGLAHVALGDGVGVHDRLPVLSSLGPGRTRLRQLLSLGFCFTVIGVVGLFVLNAGYGFQGSLEPFCSGTENQALCERPPGEGSTSLIAAAASSAPIPLPRPYLDGIRFQSKLIQGARDVYFFGEIRSGAKWYMLPVAFLLKTPISLLVLSGGTVLFMLLRRRESFDAEWLLLGFVAFIGAVFAAVGQVNIAVRYLLPVQPALFVLAGRWLAPQSGGGRMRILAASALALWLVVGSLSVHPHYLAYFSQLAGGPEHGLRYLAGTNLDLGQDLLGLKEYLEEHGHDEVQLGYYGSADARYYGIDYRYLPSVGLAPRAPGQKWWYEMSEDERLARADLQPGLVAVSANLLAGRFFPNAYEALRQREPIARIGYTIFVFDLRDAASGPASDSRSD